MNETLRKRLVGAAVLIALGILLPFGLVQWLGKPASHSGENIRIYEITPRGEVRPVADAEPTPAPEPTPEESPAAEAAPEPEPRLEPEPEPNPEPEPKPEPFTPPQTTDAGEKPPPEESPGTSWSVQVGSFRSEDNARTLMNELAADFPAFYTEVEMDGVTYYRVRIGPYADEAEARRAAAELTARGRTAQVRRET